MPNYQQHNQQHNQQQYQRNQRHRYDWLHLRRLAVFTAAVATTTGIGLAQATPTTAASIAALSSPAGATGNYSMGEAAAGNCPVDKNWLLSPSLPQEVKKSAGNESNFCDFYQFTTQAYLYLMSQAADGFRQFQQQERFPLLEFTDTATNKNVPLNSCDNQISGQTLRTSLQKSSMSTGQAGGGATIYAQDGNVVYYDVRFSRNLCDLSGSAVELQKQQLTNFPAGTYELKFAWRVLSAAEVAQNLYVTQQTTLNNKPVTLGLQGMHLVTATKDHPEFIWATFEHRLNSPNCAGEGNTHWTFASQSCAAGLPGTNSSGNACKFNQPPQNLTEPTGTPTNICRVFPFGTDPSDLKAAENLAAINQQNTELQQYLSQPDAPKALQVLRSYFNVGAIWASDIGTNADSGSVGNQRGSLRLANTVAETAHQNVNLTAGFVSNCFGCHNYKGTKQVVRNNITSQQLSHIFRDIKIGQGQWLDITAGSTISSQQSAAQICPNVCQKQGANYLMWNGNWTNSNSSAGSVCGCALKK